METSRDYKQRMVEGRKADEWPEKAVYNKYSMLVKYMVVEVVGGEMKLRQRLMQQIKVTLLH
jgi:hypothetical protein